jgi:DNA end-binding protein Ku
MHNREHIVILRPGKKGILLHTMYYADEIRQVDEFRTNTDLVKPNELAMANMLIETLKAEFEPEKYHDTYRDNLMAMIEAKKEGQKVVETPEPQMAPVIDIMEALKRSLAEKKKPVQVATAAAGEAEPESALQPVAKKRERRTKAM